MALGSQVETGRGDDETSDSCTGKNSPATNNTSTSTSTSNEPTVVPVNGTNPESPANSKTGQYYVISNCKIICHPISASLYLQFFNENSCQFNYCKLQRRKMENSKKIFP